MTFETESDCDLDLESSLLLENTGAESSTRSRPFGILDHLVSKVRYIGDTSFGIKLKTFHKKESWITATWIFWGYWLFVALAAPVALWTYASLTGDPILVDDKERVLVGIARLCVMPVLLIAAALFFPLLWSKSVAPYVLLGLEVLRQSSDRLLREPYASFVTSLLLDLFVSVFSYNWLRLWTYLDQIGQQIVEAEAEVNKEKVIAKWRDITHSIGVTRTGDPNKDWCIGIQSAESLADIVYDTIWTPLFFLAKIVGYGVLVSAVVVRQSITDIAVLVALAITVHSGLATYLLWGKMGLLLQLWLHKPFVIGDLISLGSDDSPFVCGFVEHITLSYIVIRNLESKQVYLPIQRLKSDMVQNWTRRPTKPVKLFVTVDGAANPQSVQKLSDAADRWIEGCEKVNQQGYIKCRVIGMQSGYTFEIVFYPLPGFSKNDLRQEFLLALKAMASSIGISFVANSGVSVYSAGTGTVTEQHISAAAGFAGPWRGMHRV